MLTYEDALSKILSRTQPARAASIALKDALGLVLAQTAIAPIDLPSFHNSAVDGYALCITPHDGGFMRRTLRIIGCAEAGKPFKALVRPGQAVRIFTGAPIPLGANAVVMQERVTRAHTSITVDPWPELGQNIRQRGEDVQHKSAVLPQGTLLRAQELGLLAALGLARVAVYPRPTVAILTSGTELVGIGKRLPSGRIYDSNRVMLRALVQQAGALAVDLGSVPDQPTALMRAIRRGLAADMLLIAGGVSVGDKDFTRAALNRCGVREQFWRVNIKPGMPLFFGVHNKQGRRGRGRSAKRLVFGLPGNPVSAFVTFQEFVAPAITAWMGRSLNDGYATSAKLSQELRVSTSRRTHFVRVLATGQNGTLRVAPLAGQGSHQLRSLTQADGWLRVDSSAGPWMAGTHVMVKPT